MTGGADLVNRTFLMAVAGWSHTASDSVLLCNLDTGDVERQVTLQGGVRRFVADPERNRLVVAFQSGAIGSVSLPGLSPGHRLENAHKGAVECLALSPDGRPAGHRRDGPSRGAA